MPAIEAEEGEPSPFEAAGNALHPWIAYAVLPIFAFANAGVSWPESALARLRNLWRLASPLGLFVGKQIGIFGFAGGDEAALAAGRGVIRAKLYGAAILGGIGFTMSLFIGTLAFENAAASEVIVTDQLGILAGTLLSAVAGSLVLYWVLPHRRAAMAEAR